MLFLGYRHCSLLWKKMMRSFQTNDLCLYYLLTCTSSRRSSLHNFRYGIRREGKTYAVGIAVGTVCAHFHL